MTAQTTVAPPAAQKACPMCAEHVQAAAYVCRFCGHSFHTAPSTRKGNILTVDILGSRDTSVRGFMAIVIVLIVVAASAFMIVKVVQNIQETNHSIAVLDRGLDENGRDIDGRQWLDPSAP